MEEIYLFSFRCDFFPDLNKCNLYDYYEQKLTWFLASLYKNGQIPKQGTWNLMENNGVINYYCIAHERDSFDSKYFNIYCENSLKELNELSIHPPEFNLLGETLDTPGCCKCEDSSFFILMTYYTAIYSSIRCGDCNQAVPLYKLPKLEGEVDYSSILLWETEYKACDTLYMMTNVCEKYGYQQMSKVNSNISKQGLKLCEELSLSTKKPFYYFLHKAFSPQKLYCPVCGDKWVLENALHELYAFKCDNCRLVSLKPVL